MRSAQPWRTNRARVLRAEESSAEELMWAELRNCQLDGLKFVRQCPIGAYYVDFLCRALQLVVEIDGGTHSTAEEIASDETRTAYLERRGYRIFRAHNDDIYTNLHGVLDHLLAFARGEAS